MIKVASCNTCGHASAVHPLDDDVVPIVADGSHSRDATKSKNGSSDSVNFAQEWSEKPHASVETVVDEHGELRDHHHQIGEGQVDDKHVGRGSQLFGFREQVKN